MKKNKFEFQVLRPVIGEERFNIEVTADSYESAVVLVNERYGDICNDILPYEESDITIQDHSTDYVYDYHIMYGDTIDYGKVVMNGNGEVIASDPVIEAEDNLRKIYGDDYFLIKGSELIRLHMAPNPNNLVLSAVTVGDIRDNVDKLGGDVDLDTILNHRQNIISNIDNDKVRIDVAKSLIEIFNSKDKGDE